MVLSSTYSIPPEGYPPSLLESWAAMADNLSKFVTTMTVNKEKIAASISKLNVAIANLANQNERSPAKPEHTMAPKHYPPSLEDLASSVTKVNNDLVTQTRTLFPSVPPLPTNLMLKAHQVDVICHPRTPHQACDTIVSIDAPHTIGTTNPQALLLSQPKQHVSLLLKLPSATNIHANRIRGLGFRRAKTYHPGHECHPPQFVFLES